MDSQPRVWICGKCGVRQIGGTPGAHYSATCPIDNDEFADLIISRLDFLSYDVNYIALKWQIAELAAMLPPQKK